MRWVASAFGLVMIAIGMIGMAEPALLLEATTFVRTALGLYIVAALRIVFGSVLIGAAPASRMPRTLPILGAFIVLAGIATPFIGVEGVDAIVAWWSAQSALFMRAWAGLAVLFGAFVIYAVAPRRRPG